jgi:hypothetical protein
VLKQEHTSEWLRQQDVIDDVHIIRRKALVSMQQAHRSEGEMSRGCEYTRKLTAPRHVRPVLSCARGKPPVVPGKLPCKNGERGEGQDVICGRQGTQVGRGNQRGSSDYESRGVLIVAVRQRDGSEEGRGRVCVSGQGGRRTDKGKGNGGISVRRTVQR